MSSQLNSSDSTRTTLSVEDMIYRDIKEKLFIDVDCDEVKDIQRAVEGFLLEISGALKPTQFKIQKIVPGGSVPEKTRLWDFNATIGHHCEACSIHMCSSPFLEFDYLAVLPDEGVEVVNDDCCIGFKQIVNEDERFRDCVDVFPRFQNDPIERIGAEKLLRHFSACVNRIIMTMNSDKRTNATADATDNQFDPFVNGITTPSGNLYLNPFRPWVGFTWYFNWKSKVNSLRPPKLCGLHSDLKYETIAVHVDFLPVFEYIDEDYSYDCDDDDVDANDWSGEEYVDTDFEQNGDCNFGDHSKDGDDEIAGVDNVNNENDDNKNCHAYVVGKCCDEVKNDYDVNNCNEGTGAVDNEQAIDHIIVVAKRWGDEEESVGNVRRESGEDGQKVEQVYKGDKVGINEGHGFLLPTGRNDDLTDDWVGFHTGKNKDIDNVDETGEELSEQLVTSLGDVSTPNEDADAESILVSHADIDDESDCSESDYLNYLVPIICSYNHGYCWKVSTMLIERKIIINSSPVHQEAYKLLKFLFTSMKKNEFIGTELTSYILKTTLFYHLKHNQCPETGESVKGCVHDMLRLMSNLYKIGNVPNFFNNNNLLRRPCISVEDSKLVYGYDGIVDCIIRVLMNADVIFKTDYSLREFITCIQTSAELHRDAYEHVLREKLACTVWSEAIDLNWKRLRRLKFTQRHSVMGKILLEKVHAPIFCVIL